MIYLIQGFVKNLLPWARIIVQWVERLPCMQPMQVQFPVPHMVPLVCQCGPLSKEPGLRPERCWVWQRPSFRPPPPNNFFFALLTYYGCLLGLMRWLFMFHIRVLWFSVVLTYSKYLNSILSKRKTCAASWFLKEYCTLILMDRNRPHAHSQFIL